MSGNTTDETGRGVLGCLVWCGVARRDEASNRNCLLQIISHPDQLAGQLEFSIAYFCAQTHLYFRSKVGNSQIHSGLLQLQLLPK